MRFRPVPRAIEDSEDISPVFPPDAMVRRVHAEGILLLGGGRALLMQIAHPAVAAGVAQHSTFKHHRVDRLLRTLRLPLAIVYGTRAQSFAAASRINARHVDVKGEGYDATDPALLLWVLATLIDTSLWVHDRFVRPLQASEREAYYADMKQVGMMLGIPEAALPPDVAALDVYVREVLQGLEVNETSRRLVREVLAPRLVMWTVERITAGLLPPRLRDQLGLAWSGRDERLLRAFMCAGRLILPRLPRRLRAPPWFLLPPGATLPR